MKNIRHRFGSIMNNTRLVFSYKVTQKAKVSLQTPYLYRRDFDILSNHSRWKVIEVIEGEMLCII